MEENNKIKEEHTDDSEERAEGKYIHDQKNKYLGIILLFFISFGVLILLLLLLSASEKGNTIYVKLNYIALAISLAGIIVAGIGYIRYWWMANNYCPYCYKKGYTKTLLKSEKIRTYTKSEKTNDNKIKRFLVEEWEHTYKYECCGEIETKSETEKIDIS